MSQNTAVYAVIPVAIVFIILKICLIVWRLYVRQQRRDAMRRTMLASCIALQRPEVMSGQMLFEGMHPSWGRYSDGPLLYSVGGPGRCRLDSSLPPSYDQAVTGEDNATTLEGEWSSPQRPLLLHYTLPPPSPPPSPQLPLLHNEARPLPLQSEDALPPYTPTDTSVVIISVPPLPIHDQQNR